MSTYLDMKQPHIDPLPAAPKPVTRKRVSAAVAAWIGKAIQTAFRPLVGGQPAMHHRAPRPTPSVW
jgi:hypothetical protein